MAINSAQEFVSFWRLFVMLFVSVGRGISKRILDDDFGIPACSSADPFLRLNPTDTICAVDFTTLEREFAMSNAHESDGPQEEERYAEPESADNPSADSGDSPISNEEILERVMRETLASEPGSALLQVIVRFAERNQDRKITQPEVAEALVDEILKRRFTNIPLPPECSEFISTSLLDDPDARDRLKRLWAHAVGEANAH